MDTHKPNTICNQAQLKNCLVLILYKYQYLHYYEKEVGLQTQVLLIPVPQVLRALSHIPTPNNGVVWCLFALPVGVSLYSPCSPGARSVDEAGQAPPASATRGLGLTLHPVLTMGPYIELSSKNGSETLFKNRESS